MNRKDMRDQENKQKSRVNRLPRFGAALFLFILSPFIGEFSFRSIDNILTIGFALWWWGTVHSRISPANW